ncbi:transporter [Sphingomonas sp. PB4P5]|uniref:transporter n=1 Tax=Parasphingomonas puruogangriensis TaxID=3096155 RepID=UPI002FC8F6D8
MTLRPMIAGLFLSAAIAAPALAEERDYCPSRPGLGTTPCTISPGKISVETALVDWTRDDNSDAREDTILVGDTQIRFGVTDTVELQAGWTPFGHVRTRDKVAGGVDSANRVGDAYLGFKANLVSPDGSGFSAAVSSFATLPVGRMPTGAGDWGAGLLAPISYDLNDTLNLQFTPELDAAVDEDGNGRHLAYSGVAGLGIKLSEQLTTTLEVQLLRDRDPAEKTSQALAGVSLGYMVGDDLQLDCGINAGLNRQSPDTEMYLGISRRF